ncbi:HAD hydrolase-like protein [Candidatus Pacearchaeota archaeon]|nr:HAD hydrolase-like protein [Candidatus Pacearchaeota archaeon]
MIHIEPILDYDGVVAESFDLAHALYKELSADYCLKPFANKEEFANLFNGDFMTEIAARCSDHSKLPDFFQKMKSQLTLRYYAVPMVKDMKQFLMQVTGWLPNSVILSANHHQVVEGHLMQYHVHWKGEIVGLERKVKKRDYLAGSQATTPRRVVYICDTVGDIREAKQADVDTIAVGWGFHTTDKLVAENPTYFAETLPALTDLIYKLR